jgi:autotransporter strand-loop-strand O-heptosyltransferase
MGDTLCSTPTIRKVSKSYGHKIDVMTKRRDIFEKNPYVENILDYRDGEIEGYDEVYETYNTKIKVNKNMGNEFYENPIEIKLSNFEARQLHALSLGITLYPDEMEYDFIPDEQTELSKKVNKDYIVLHVTKSWPSRTWDTHKWQKLIDLIKEKTNFKIITIGKSHKEESYHGDIVKDIPVLKNVDIDNCIYEIDGYQNVNNRETLSEMCHIINNASCLISFDSGPIHLAGTTDTEIIQIGSSIRYEKTAPYRNGSQHYKFRSIGGECKLFCATDPKYSVKEWGTINSMPYYPNCQEGYKEFKCQPSVNQIFNELVKITNIENKEKLMVITPHLSTGGCPQYLLDYLIENKNNYSDIKVVEFTNFSDDFVIQKNKIKNLIGEENLICLGHHSSWNNEELYVKEKSKLIDIIDNYKPDTIWMNEFPESYDYKLPPDNVTKYIYRKNREYKIIETTHSSGNSFNFDNKKFIPDEFMFCSPLHLEMSKKIDIPKKVWEKPIVIQERPNREEKLKELGLDPSYYHVLNVGLFHVNKNQKFIYDLAEKFIDKKVQFHFVGNDCFINDCGINNTELKNCKRWGEKDNVEDFMSCMDLFLFPSKKELNPLSVKEALSWDMDIIVNKDEYTSQYDEYEKFKTLDKVNIENYINDKIEENRIKIDDIYGLKLEILGGHNENYLVEFIDKDTNNVIYSGDIKNNMWVTPNVKYYINWEIKINGESIYKQDLNNKRVFINFESSSLGDTIAWLPYVLEFKKKHNCKVFVSTFKNFLFENLDEYKEIGFIKKGERYKNINKIYNIGWYYDNNEVDYSKNPQDFKKIPLQQTCSDILGLEFKEIKPSISFKDSGIPIKDKYVCISIHSTAQAKYWNYPNGWQIITDYLKSIGYKVVLLSKEPNGYMGNKLPSGIIIPNKKDLDTTMNYLKYSDFFIGISSGLSWLSWAIGTQTILISGFSEEYTEPTTNIERIINKNVCNGCFNKHRLDAGDWNWCPLHKGTNRQFECTKNIHPNMIIDKINKL